ncbi:MAG TPA: COX15/CtaA family protein [Rhizomicrobium sp.]|nr:COX15/CtaA family protein [Rhizomicrobium sp.]
MTNPVAQRKAVGIWLLCVAALIAAMVVVGGLTRLTGSGLSITQWKPVTGVVPPMSEPAWQHEFSLYQQIPQYQLENRGMTLDQFKAIYWWEWTHRFLGRFIGFAFLLPFLWFVWRGAIGRRDIPRMVVLFVLGGLQGVVGWWMVASGLETRVSVSQYRLAAHLGVAIILLGAIIWVALEYLRGTTAQKRPARMAFALIGLVYLQMLLGALVAGLHAGLIYNTWPSMDGRVFPEGAFYAQPWWINIFENAGLAQFDHRIGAYLIALLVIAIWIVGNKFSGWTRKTEHVLLTLTAFQIVLGILTLLHQAPIALSALHQITAAALFSAAVWHAFEMRFMRSAPDPDRR